MRWFKNPKYNFMGGRKYGYIISGVLFFITVVSFVLHGGPSYGVDFRGGTLLQMRFEDKTDPDKALQISIDEVREVFSEFGYGKAEIKHYGSPQEITARMDISENTDELTKQIISRLDEKFPGYNVIEMRKETVGPKVGQELVWSAIWAILVAMLLILIYLMWRFELRFGVGAVLALFHDVLITLGIFSLLNIEITIEIVAALLTIVGYSLNDTIVVFDRIRENLKGAKHQVLNFNHVINSSINETLSRTVVTSGTTLMVVIILYFFGGEVIKNFAFALICGVVIGTYSTIYIASPVLVEWEHKKREKALVKK